MAANEITQTAAFSKLINDSKSDIAVNNNTTVDDTIAYSDQYYANIRDFLIPNQKNLELVQNIFPGDVIDGTNVPGQPESYTGPYGEGYLDNLGYLGNNAYPPVTYPNDRVSELNECAKTLPMFLASSLLPKPSVNADDNALGQNAAKALAAWTNLSANEQIGGLTNIRTPYGAVTDFRDVPSIPNSQMIQNAFNNPSNQSNNENPILQKGFK